MAKIWFNRFQLILIPLSFAGYSDLGILADSGFILLRAFILLRDSKPGSRETAISRGGQVVTQFPCC